VRTWLLIYNEVMQPPSPRMIVLQSTKLPKSNAIKLTISVCSLLNFHRSRDIRHCIELCCRFVLSEVNKLLGFGYGTGCGILGQYVPACMEANGVCFKPVACVLLRSDEPSQWTPTPLGVKSSSVINAFNK
jgi:hypothetical protein